MHCKKIYIFSSLHDLWVTILRNVNYKKTYIRNPQIVPTSQTQLSEDWYIVLLTEHLLNKKSAVVLMNLLDEWGIYKSLIHSFIHFACSEQISSFTIFKTIVGRIYKASGCIDFLKFSLLLVAVQI